jgi:hypothetical protein
MPASAAQAIRAQQKAAARQAAEVAAAHARLRESWEYQGGLWYCRTHAVLARWTASGPQCWKCNDAS